MRQQTWRVLQLLKDGPLSTFDLRARGVSHPAGRVQELRDKGYVIDTISGREIDAHGHLHYSVARYVLRAEPTRTGLRGEAHEISKQAASL